VNKKNQFQFDYGHPCCNLGYPPPREIQPRVFENLDSESDLRMALDIGKKRKITVAVVQKGLKQAESSLRNSIKRYNDIRKRGDAAMSSYDLSMGYTARRSGLPLTYNHVGYYKGQVRLLNYWIKKLSPNVEAVSPPQQLEMF